jgi:hypothetical protein
MVNAQTGLGQVWSMVFPCVAGCHRSAGLCRVVVPGETGQLLLTSDIPDSSPGLLSHSLNACSHGCQLGLYGFVTAIQVVDSRDLGDALSRQTR